MARPLRETARDERADAETDAYVYCIPWLTSPRASVSPWT